MGIIRNTKSVKILLDEFNNDDAVSVIELIRRLKTKLNKTTIYRVLDKLEDDGVLHSFLGNKGINGMLNVIVVLHLPILTFIRIFNV